MKKFIIKINIIGLVLIAISYFFIPVNSNDYLMAYKKKCELLEYTSSPRIIFIGGSNLAFGLDSKRIQDSLGINVINYGLHAGIGLKYMTDDISMYYKPGDVLVFAPEWTQFYTIMYGQSYELSTIIKAGNFKKLNLLNSKQYISVVCGFPVHLKQYILPDKITEKTYKSSNFNQLGDEERHWSLENVYHSYPEPITAKFDNKFGEYFIKKLNELQTKSTVIMIPPACCSVAMKKWDKQVKEVEKYFSDNGFPFIIDPSNCSFGEEYMYDTDYHLNKKGVDIRTSSVIDALKNVLNKETDK